MAVSGFSGGPPPPVSHPDGPIDLGVGGIGVGAWQVAAALEGGTGAPPPATYTGVRDAGLYWQTHVPEFGQHAYCVAVVLGA